MGKIDSDGTVRNASNQTPRKIASDGTVRNASNASLGRVDNGSVRNASNVSIGRTDSNVKKEWAAVFYFFKFFQ